MCLSSSIDHNYMRHHVGQCGFCACQLSAIGQRDGGLHLTDLYVRHILQGIHFLRFTLMNCRPLIVRMLNIIKLEGKHYTLRKK